MRHPVNPNPHDDPPIPACYMDDDPADAVDLFLLYARDPDDFYQEIEELDALFGD